MKNILRIIAAATFVLVAGTVLGNQNERYETYYSDSAFQNQTGQEAWLCDDTHYLIGNYDNYKINDIYACTGAHLTHNCWQNVGGSWVSVTCPF